jgi:hypothetical protein
MTATYHVGVEEMFLRLGEQMWAIARGTVLCTKQCCLCLPEDKRRILGLKALLLVLR